MNNIKTIKFSYNNKNYNIEIYREIIEGRAISIGICNKNSKDYMVLVSAFSVTSKEDEFDENMEEKIITGRITKALNNGDIITSHLSCSKPFSKQFRKEVKNEVAYMTLRDVKKFISKLKD